VMDNEKREACIDNLIQQIGWIEDIKTHQFPGWGHVVSAMRQAVALLKECGPRVMSLDEVNRLEQNDVVWLEDNGVKEVIPAIVVEHNHRYAQQSVCLMIVENPRLWIETFDYKERWRCWTQKPTDEQAEAEPWDG